MTRQEFNKACAALILLDLKEADAIASAATFERESESDSLSAFFSPKIDAALDGLRTAIAPAVAAGEQLKALGEEIRARLHATFPDFEAGA